MAEPLRLVLVAGARPNFVKVAALHAALVRRATFAPVLLTTRQHRDDSMASGFARGLGLPAPDVELETGGSTPAARLGSIMERFEAWLGEARPDLVVVVGDVDSTLAAGLVAARSGVALAHVEAGLRSRDRAMPEELNRIVVDALADLLFVTEPAGIENLRAEGRPEDRVHLVGNVVIDTLRRHREAAASTDVLARLGLSAGEFAVATVHRPSNVDRADRLGDLVDALMEIGRDVPVVLPLHPRTSARLAEFGLRSRLAGSGVVVTEPQPYLDFLHLMASSRVVLTDSGGLQEETTALGIPCLTLRDNTERPITLVEGTNRLAGSRRPEILAAWRRFQDGDVPTGRTPALWDGRAAERVADVLESWAASPREPRS